MFGELILKFALYWFLEIESNITNIIACMKSFGRDLDIEQVEVATETTSKAAEGVCYDKW